MALLLGVAYAVSATWATSARSCKKRNRNGQRPIYFGDEIMLAVLVSARADLNSADYDGNTPLLVASAGGHLELAKLLIDTGAGISDANREGNTPTMAASAGGYLELAKVLIDAGAGILAANLEGNTPMMAASAGGT